MAVIFPKTTNYLHLFSFITLIVLLIVKCNGNDILGCGGFVKSHVNLDFSKIEIGLYTKQGNLKDKTECAPTNGYYFLPLYEIGEYVLKVHPPPGWSIEPPEASILVDGVSDSCTTGRDINFEFNGFGITGKVVTAGELAGPTGVVVQLTNNADDVRETVTKAGGDFHFTPVIPGKYTVKAYHSKWKLDPSTTTVQVSGGNTALPPGSLAVRGYDVRGKVTADGNPISGIHVLLYTEKEGNQRRVEGCSTDLLQGVPGNPLCHAITDASGVFSFGLVPAGEYYFLPLTKPPGQNKVSYNVKPEKLRFSVKHDGLFIQNAFEIIGFNLVGRVVTHPSGEGIAGARVILNGQAIGVTDNQGKYALNNIKANTYTMNFAAEQCEFADTSINISPTGVVTLPDVWPVRWRVCGQVTPGADSDSTFTARSVSIQTEQRGGGQTEKVVSVQSDVKNEGKWCALLHPGVYLASVLVSEQERREGLQFYPVSQRIVVSRSPVSGVVFSQLRAVLRGAIRCNDELLCSSQQVTLRALAPDGSYMGQAVVASAQGGKYEFKDVLPGSYEVSVPADRLCWNSAKHNVAVTAAEATVPDFVHTGYAILFKASHDTDVSYKTENAAGTIAVPAGTSQQCVPQAGAYEFVPSGCHKYKPDRIQYETSQKQNEVVHIIAYSHAVGIKILSNDAVKDLTLKVAKERTEVLGPLTPNEEKEGNMFVYHTTLHLPEGETIVVSAHSDSLLMTPRDPQQLVGAGECRPTALVLLAERGAVLAGSVAPPIAGVHVTLTSEDSVEIQTTRADGKYRFGPLPISQEYKLTAEKESYVLSGPDAYGNFRAHKLAEIIVTIVDENTGLPLQTALVSVSGGQYRRNMGTGADGKLTFGSLAPSDYFVKPLMKEYKFSPPHTIVSVAEGQTYNVKLSGIRVACSALGHVVTLSGAGLGGAVVVATPVDPTSPCPAEEGAAETSGAFRVRGLLPGCRYRVTLRETPELVGVKVAPPFVDLDIQSESEDVEDIRLIAIQPVHITDANVLIQTPQVEHYKTLKLKVFLDSQPQYPIFSTKLDPTGLSQQLNPGLLYPLPRLPADNKTYVLQLESTLSQSTHTYDMESIEFKSDGKFKFFNLEFLPKIRVTDQDLSQTSLLVLPLLAILGFAFIHRDKVWAYISKVHQSANADKKRAKDKVTH